MFKLKLVHQKSVIRTFYTCFLTTQYPFSILYLSTQIYYKMNCVQKNLF